MSATPRRGLHFSLVALNVLETSEASAVVDMTLLLPLLVKNAPKLSCFALLFYCNQLSTTKNACVLG